MSFIYDQHDFTALSYDTIKVGRHIKASKIRHSWRFEIASQEHTVDFYVSRLSRKKKLIVDGLIQLETKGSGSGVQIPVKIGSHMLSINEVGKGTYDIRFNNRSFQSYMAGKRSQSLAGRDPFARDSFARQENPFTQSACGDDKIENNVQVDPLKSNPRGFRSYSVERSRPLPKAKHTTNVDILNLDPEHKPVIRSVNQPQMNLNQFMTGANNFYFQGHRNRY